MTRPHFGRCRRDNHGRFQAYADEFAIGVCMLGYWIEVAR